MNQSTIDITGLGSVGPHGPVSGPLCGPLAAPSVVTAWPTAGVRYALPALPFRTADVLPKVNTRRLDRLSTWSLAAAALALRDAGLDLSAVDGARTAVVSAIGLGCLDLTEAYLGSAHEHGWQQTDPIYFPETLGNVPAAHVARVFGCLGPNLTVGSRGLAAEAALLTAASLLRVGQADRVLVLAGDLLTRGLFDWYEAAGLLSADGGGFVPSEGVAAMVLEAPGRQRARARVMDARWVQADTESAVGRTPWSARVPLDPQADGGVGRGPGGPPHQFLAYSANLRALDARFCGLALAPFILLAAFCLTPAAGFPADQFPVAAYPHIPPAARLFAPDKFGGYLIYRSNGTLKVFFDGRSDLYGADFLRQYARLVQVRPGWRRYWESFHFTHALVPADAPLLPALEQIGWRPLYQDKTATLLVFGGT